MVCLLYQMKCGCEGHSESCGHQRTIEQLGEIDWSRTDGDWWRLMEMDGVTADLCYRPARSMTTLKDHMCILGMDILWLYRFSFPLSFEWKEISSLLWESSPSLLSELRCFKTINKKTQSDIWFTVAFLLLVSWGYFEIDVFQIQDSVDEWQLKPAGNALLKAIWVGELTTHIYSCSSAGTSFILQKALYTQGFTSIPNRTISPPLSPQGKHCK